MQIVLLTAVGVGAATMLGSLIGFCFGKISKKLNDTLLAFACGVMLAASVIGLILPSLEYGRFSTATTVAGIFCGAVFINVLDRMVPSLSSAFFRKNTETDSHSRRVALFVIAIGVHNIPEGIAAGVGFGQEDIAHALMIAGSIAFQNIPEGMVIIPPLLDIGVSRKRSLACAMWTGVVEIIGALVGYFAVGISKALLPFCLAFAGGTMLYVISEEMIPEIHSKDGVKTSTYALLLGFCLMTVADFIIK